MGWIFGEDDGFSVYARIGDNLKHVIMPKVSPTKKAFRGITLLLIFGINLCIADWIKIVEKNNKLKLHFFVEVVFVGLIYATYYVSLMCGMVQIIFSSNN